MYADEFLLILEQKGGVHVTVDFGGYRYSIDSVDIEGDKIIINLTTKDKFVFLDEFRVYLLKVLIKIGEFKTKIAFRLLEKKQQVEDFTLRFRNTTDFCVIIELYKND